MTLHPSFRPWLWCVVWLVIGWSAIFQITHEYWPRLAGVTQADIMASQRSDKPGSFRVVALGDSLLSSSLPNPQAFNAMLPRDIFWAQMVAPAQDWRVFKSLLFKISELRPDVLLIQDDVLLQRGPEWGGYLNQARMAVAYAGRKALGLRQKRLGRPDRLNPAAQREAANTPSFADRYRNNVPVSPATIDFLHRLKKKFPRIVVMHLPKSSALEAAEESVQWQDTLRMTLGQMGIEFVTVGAPLADEQYSDGSHTNKRGRSARIEQFRGLIRNLQE